MTIPKGVAAGRRQYIEHRNPSSSSREYTTEQVRASAVTRGRALHDAARGNQSAREALQDAAAIAAAGSALDSLVVQAGQEGIDLGPPAA